jgi:hypothetical protein
MPLASAGKALRLMNTNRLTALGTGPFLPFHFYEVPDAEISYVCEVLDHTHTILRPIALIQLFKPGAGKAVATEAIVDSAFHYLFTVLDSAQDAGLRFDSVITAATGACLFVSRVGAAETTVHAAGSDQRDSKSNWLGRSAWCHVTAPANAVTFSLSLFAPGSRPIRGFVGQEVANGFVLDV